MDQEPIITPNEPITHARQESKEPKNNITVPIAIIFAGILIAGAILLSGKSQKTALVVPNNIESQITVDAVTTKDHILGSANAAITFVEFSDTECPFCKRFHTTMHALVDKYGKDGKVAWVYRHFPIYKSVGDTQPLHSRAGKESEATECVAELGGEAAFWKYLDSIYTVTPSNNGLNPSELPILAAQVGVDVAKFNTCLSSGKYTAFVDASYQRAAATAQAVVTPHTVILFKKATDDKLQTKMLEDMTAAYATIAPQAQFPQDLFTFDPSGKIMAFSGALPYEVIEALVKAVLK